MSPSLLFSHDMSTYPNMATPSKHSQPEYIPITPPPSSGVIAVDHWLSQQHTLRSNARQAPRVMSTSHHTNSFISNIDDMHEYTFETHAPHDDLPSNPIWPATYLRELQMITPQPTMQQQPTMTPSPTYSDWSNLSSFNNSSDNLSSTNYILGAYSPESINMAPFTAHSRASSHSHVSPGGSDQALSPLYPASPGLPSPSSPGSTPNHLLQPGSPNINNMSQLDHPASSENANSEHQLYTHRQQYQLFREVFNLPMNNAGPFLPQQMYKPHTTSDRKRYVEEVMLEPPLYFITEHPQQYGILLKDVLHSRTKRLTNREQVVFEGRGPSVSIRLEWPGYRQWSRQIPTKDFRSPPQPITLAKLAKNVAKCVQRFMQEAKSLPMDEDTSDPRWRIGTGSHDIKFEDLVLVSIHHVSLGSWQPQLRLAHPLRPRSQQPQQHQQMHYLPPTPRSASNGSPASLLFPQLPNL